MAMPTVVGVGAEVNGIGAVTPAYPAAYTATTNDIGVTFVECESTDTITPPTGWALVIASIVSTGTTSKLSAIWRRIQAGDTAPSIADAGDHMVARMIVVRGCLTTGNPWNVATQNTELVSDTTVSIPAIVTTSADCLILAAFGTGQDIASTAGATGWANASLVNVTERMDDWTSQGLGGGFAMATGEKAAPGAVSATTATLSLTANFKTLMTIALTANAPTPPPPPARRSYQGYPYLTVQ